MSLYSLALSSAVACAAALLLKEPPSSPHRLPPNITPLAVEPDFFVRLHTLRLHRPALGEDPLTLSATALFKNSGPGLQSCDASGQSLFSNLAQTTTWQDRSGGLYQVPQPFNSMVSARIEAFVFPFSVSQVHTVSVSDPAQVLDPQQWEAVSWLSQVAYCSPDDSGDAWFIATARFHDIVGTLERLDFLAYDFAQQSWVLQRSVTVNDGRSQVGLESLQGSVDWLADQDRIGSLSSGQLGLRLRVEADFGLQGGQPALESAEIDVPIWLGVGGP